MLRTMLRGLSVVIGGAAELVVDLFLVGLSGFVVLLTLAYFQVNGAWAVPFTEGVMATGIVVSAINRVNQWCGGETA
jgi:hypothetical protein